MEYFKKILKTTILFAIIGVALAAAAPLIASAAISMGAPELLINTLATSTHPIWGGLFFGGFGALNTALSPIIDAVFGDNGKKQTPTVDKDTANAAPAMVMAHAPSVAADRMDEAEKSTRFQDKVGGKRSQAASFQERVDASRAEAAEHTV